MSFFKKQAINASVRKEPYLINNKLQILSKLQDLQV
jgi:hypothetical protein